LQLNPLSQSIKLINQNVNTGSNLSSSKSTEELCAFYYLFLVVFTCMSISNTSQKFNIEVLSIIGNNTSHVVTKLW